MCGCCCNSDMSTPPLLATLACLMSLDLSCTSAQLSRTPKHRPVVGQADHTLYKARVGGVLNSVAPRHEQADSHDNQGWSCSVCKCARHARCRHHKTLVMSLDFSGTSAQLTVRLPQQNTPEHRPRRAGRTEPQIDPPPAPVRPAHAKEAQPIMPMPPKQQCNPAKTKCPLRGTNSAKKILTETLETIEHFEASHAGRVLRCEGICSTSQPTEHVAR